MNHIARNTFAKHQQQRVIAGQRAENVRMIMGIYLYSQGISIAVQRFQHSNIAGKLNRKKPETLRKPLAVSSLRHAVSHTHGRQNVNGSARSILHSVNLHRPHITGQG